MDYKDWITPGRMWLPHFNNPGQFAWTPFYGIIAPFGRYSLNNYGLDHRQDFSCPVERRIWAHNRWRHIETNSRITDDAGDASSAYNVHHRFGDLIAVIAM